MHVMHAHAYGCRVSSHVGVEVCGQQRDGGGGGGAFFASVVVRQRGPKCHTPCFLHAVPPQSAIAHGACYQSTHTTSPCITHTTHTPANTSARTRGGGMWGVVVRWLGAPRQCVTGFQDKPTHTTFGGLCAFTYNHPNTWNRSLMISRPTRPRPGTRARAEG